MVLALKKSIALQVRGQLSASVAHILGGSSASMTTSLASQAPPMVVPVPSAGWADAGAQETPSKVTEQPVMAVIPLPMIGRTGLPTVLVASTMVGVMLLVWTPPM